MKIARIRHDGPDGGEPRIVVAADGAGMTWIDVRVAERLRLEQLGVAADAARTLAATVVPGSLAAALRNGPLFREALAAAANGAPAEAHAPAGARLLAPVDPPAYRDFMAFEQHFTYPLRRDCAPIPDVLYELPISYMGSAQAVVGPEEEIVWPAHSQHIDYELELGIVIGRDGRDLTPEQALDHVLGVTLLNDFSARDIQMREMAGRLGPSKGKHFANAVGPCIVTLDALDAANLRMEARINGETWSSNNTSTMMWSIAEIVAWASAGEPLVAGTLLGSGTVGGGTGMELERKLSDGDVVELELEGVGILRNRVRAAAAPGWFPSPKPRTPEYQSNLSEATPRPAVQ
jgi:2-keto-4-pentenoate hydratase/2-oxohepta-3-ene-1,7-dioic acid hydratase in catechol pathway